MVSVYHSKTSIIPDDPNTDLIRPSDWNAAHVLAPLSAVAKLLGSDSTSTTIAEITLGSGLSLSGSTLSTTDAGGTVTSVTVTGANGIGVSGSPITTSGTIALALGAITPSSVAASGTVSGSNLSGTNTGDQTITLTGDVTGSGTSSFAATLATVNANTGSFGSATQVGTFTVDGKGRITAAANTTISGVAPGGAAGGDLSGTYPNPTVAKINGATLGTSTPTAGNLLIGSGSQWVTNAVSGDISLTSAGVTAIGASKVTNAMLAGSIDAAKINTGVVSNAEFNFLDGVTGGIQGQIDGKQPLDATLTALAAYNTNGILTQTAADTFAGRTITGTANRIALTNGDGVSGNPTVDISASYVGQTTITTLGTIATGVWQGTAINLSSYASGTLQAAQFPALTGDITTSAGSLATTLATVNSNIGSFGSASQVATFTVNAKGLITATSNTTISIASTAVSDFSEAVDDRAAALIQNGTGITWSYNDAGGTLTPTITLSPFTTTNLSEGSNLYYTDARVRLNRLDQMAAPTASVSFNSQKITNLLDPVSAQDAATKNYVDTVAQGLDAKESVYVATAAALPANTYDNGSSGVGATITANATGVLTVDGQAVSLNDRVLVKDESTQANNGIYKCTTAGAVGVAFVLTRGTDADTSAELIGAYVFVEIGTTNISAGFVCTNSSTITIGTTAIAFTQFSGAGQITAGSGLSKTGNTLDVNVDSSSIEINSDTLRVKALGITNAMLAGSIDLTTKVTGDLPFANLAQGSALSVLGVAGNSTADVASIAAASDYQVMRRSGTAIAFGAVNLASSNAVTGSLPVANLAALTVSKAVVSDGSGLLSTSATTSTEIGYIAGLSSAVQTQIDGKQALDADLTAIAALSSTGIAARTASNTWSLRTMTGTSNRLSISNGDGVAGNPTFDIDAAYVGQTTITTAGTLTTGTWTATKISEVYGGTNQNSYTLGDVLYASASNTLSKLAGNITTTRKFFRQTGNGSVSADPAWDTILAADIPASALTKVDDTNVTLTLGGSPTTALLAAASLTLGWTGTLAVARGGTGTGTAFTAGSVIFAGASGTYAQDNANFFWDDANNRLGIGTASPTQRLHVAGGSALIDSGYSLYVGGQTDAGTNGLRLVYASNNAYIDFKGSGNLNFRADNSNGGTTRMALTSGGYLGIGTASPSVPLHVYATTEQLRLAYNSSYYCSFTTGSSGILAMQSSAGTVQITSASYAARAVSIAHDSGSGTISSNYGDFYVGVYNAGNLILGALGSTTKGNYHYGAAHQFSVGASNTIAMYIDGSGVQIASAASSARAVYIAHDSGSGIISSNYGDFYVGVYNAGNLILGASGSATKGNYYYGSIHQFSVGVSNTLGMYTDGSANTGFGTSSPTSKIHVAGSVAAAISTITSNTTLDGTYHTVLCDAAGGAFTVTLPAASGCVGRLYRIKKINSTSSAITIDGNSTETIDGELTQTLSAQYSAIDIISNGTSWYIF